LSEKVIIGVVGPGDGARQETEAAAYDLGQRVAREGWILLTGGRNAGVMDAASRGAKAAGGLTVGILPGRDSSTRSAAVDIPIVTDMGSARNNINVLSSHLLIVCGMSPGTASEVALALKAGRAVIFIAAGKETRRFFSGLAPEGVFFAEDPAQAVEIAKSLLPRSR